jgi:hypothetical protein
MWGYDYYAHGIDRLHEPVHYGDLLVFAIMLASAIFGAADAIVGAIRGSKS